MKVEYDIALSKGVKHLARLDIAGGGQVVVQGDYAYIGHMKAPHGTSILDVSDPTNPKVVSHVEPPEWSHTHKVRVAGDLMITNVEQDQRHFLRKGDRIPELRNKGLEDAAIAVELGVKPDDIPTLDAARERGYDGGGFRVWDISDKTAPRLLSYVKTHGFGVHRFDMDENFAYISTEMEGYVGNILVIYDLADPTNPTEVSRWHMPGQHVAKGETPTGPGYSHRLHHAMRCGDELWAATWHAGMRVLDASDITNPRQIGSYVWPEAIPEPTHTVMPLEQRIDGRRYAVAIDEEHAHQPGRLHGFLWVMDVTDLDNIEAVAAWDLSERACPYVGEEGVRFGAHQYREKLDGTLVYCTWFAGGLRVLDLADPLTPQEVAYFMPERGPGGAPQSNDVDVDDHGRIYLLDRVNGLDILEMT
ncbi:LVIVD repeat-containing protein [Marivita sp. S0852]|uniref:LVIVD repeat-containing protein n=1 Tax=Marivita sp. S0852 TaxID=3373893 RepID=UPI00398254A2